MDPSNPSHIAKMFMDYMNDGMDEELVRLYFKSEAQKEGASSSRPRRRRRNIERNREEGHEHLFNDYFSKAPVYTDEQFRRRYRMHKHVFLRIVEALGEHDEYFWLLPNIKKVQERILNEHLEFSNPDLQSYVTQLDLGTWMH
ncbi:uncharacterized protein LOC131650285 [Vicia villosa]|uniref:uncharacterized protein LOC131650285 n=1 Tax=Vicia villosa TaxID=3911 RepID=UPI00273B6F40|nr:uncharacterized protein LOC131650285 [Vicia villosa]